MARAYEHSTARRAANAAISTLLKFGVAPGPYVLLTVPGRKTGRLHTTPVRLHRHDGRRYLVAPYGEVGWVHNARVAGSVTLTRGRRSETVHVHECDAAEAGAVLRSYVQAEAITRPYFDASPDDPAENFAAESHGHPVFRIDDDSGPEASQ